MRDILDQAELQRRIGQQLLGPLEDAISLARRYRDVDAFHDYIGQRARLVIPALVLIGVTAVACGLTPILALVGTRTLSALTGLATPDPPPHLPRRKPGRSPSPPARSSASG